MFRKTTMAFATFAVLVTAVPANAGYFEIEPLISGDGSTIAEDPKWEGLQAHVRPARKGVSIGRIPVRQIINDLNRMGYYRIRFYRDRGDLYYFRATDRYGDRVRLKVNATSGRIVGHKVL